MEMCDNERSIKPMGENFFVLEISNFFFWGKRWKHATMSDRFIEVFFLLFLENKFFARRRKFFCYRKFQIFEGKNGNMQ